MEARVKDLTIIDIGLVKWSVFFATVLVVKLFPALLKIDATVLLVLTMACAAKPLYTLWIKKTVT